MRKKCSYTKRPRTKKENHQQPFSLIFRKGKKNRKKLGECRNAEQRQKYPQTPLQSVRKCR
ncbi:TPA: hypothetical protein ACGO3A_000754, partial [Streptococcus suis]